MRCDVFFGYYGIAQRSDAYSCQLSDVVCTYEVSEFVIVFFLPFFGSDRKRLGLRIRDPARTIDLLPLLYCIIIQYVT